jgi:hypothetical protein
MENKKPVGRPKGSKNPNAGRKTKFKAVSEDFSVKTPIEIIEHFGRKKCNLIMTNALLSVYFEETGNNLAR